MRTVAVVPAYNNEATVGDTVEALARDHRIDEVIVVDDGSDDSTSKRAEDAGARVIRLDRNRGKQAALDAGMSAASQADVLVMVDADTADTSSAVVDLISPILAGEADMVIGVLPPAGSQGGFGLVRDFAGWCIRIVSGYRASAPLSGQRALRREVYLQCRPLGYGYAVDASLTSDAVRKGFRVIELPVNMTHAHRGRSIAGFLHRARQGYHIVRSFLPRMVKAAISPRAK